MRIAVATLWLLGLGAGFARADRPRFNIEIGRPPAFYPQDALPYNGGYYTTPDGNYYHYDRDRRGWHYGRNHDDGVRWEREHQRGHWERDAEDQDRD